MVRLLLGSDSDVGYGNILLSVFKVLGIECKVSIISCHRHEYFLKEFVTSLSEGIIIFLGGMSLAAPGVIKAILISVGIMGKTVFAIPTDIAARSAIEDLPIGVPLITSGLNTISVKHSITNSALAIAHLIVTFNSGSSVKNKLQDFYSDLRKDKPFIADVELENGLIPIKRKEN